MSKAEIIRAGIELGIDYGLTSSCYDPAPKGAPCGACDSCILRQKGFAEAGVEDPLSAKSRYRASVRNAETHSQKTSPRCSR